MDSSSDSSYHPSFSWSMLSLRSDKIYEREDVMKVQLMFIDTLMLMSRREKKKQKLFGKLYRELLGEYIATEGRYGECYENFMFDQERHLTKIMAMVEKKSEDFGDELEEVVDLYVNVNEMMKEWKKTAAAQDKFVINAQKNVSLFDIAKKNLEKLQQQMATLLPPITSTSSTSSTDISQTFVRANTITNPMKPIEVEIVTHTTRIVKELELLREQLQLCPNVEKLSAPMVKQSKKVTKMVLKELPARSMKAYIDTLPPEHRD